MADTPGIPTPASFASIGIETFPTGEDVYNSVKISLADICAKATTQYAHKNYDEAADLFARASELQAELNGEMAPENGEILFLYGRSLFKVGQAKSDVLGGKAGKEKKKPSKQVSVRKDKVVAEGQATETESATAAKDEPAIDESKETTVDAKKPLFQFTGDENFEDSDDEEDAAGGDDDGEAEEEEDDDLAAAFEVLDLARVLFEKRLEDPEAPLPEGRTSEPTDKGKATGDSAVTTHIKERLADTHDLLAEISLENERFPGAVTDFKSALKYKQELYSEESEIIAEAHFKLSLALEFASISRPKEDGGEEAEPAGESDAYLDQNLRDEAVKELEAAINSTKLKLQNKEVDLASMHSPDDNDVTREQITEVKDILVDMENRLAELKGPAINVKEALYGPEAIGGVLGAAMGESKEEATARIEEAKKGATDLTGLVKRKKTSAEATSNGSGKRKADDIVQDEKDNGSKKAKVEDGTDD